MADDTEKKLARTTLQLPEAILWAGRRRAVEVRRTFPRYVLTLIEADLRRGKEEEHVDRQSPREVA